MRDSLKQMPIDNSNNQLPDAASKRLKPIHMSEYAIKCAAALEDFKAFVNGAEIAKDALAKDADIIEKSNAFGLLDKHFKILAQALRIKSHNDLGTDYSGFENGCAYYLAEHDDLPLMIDESINRLRYGEDIHHTLLGHIQSNFVSMEHGQQLLSDLKQHIGNVSLSGKTVVDIGGGTAVLSAAISDEVCSDSGGKVICLDINPDFMSLAHYLKKFDSRYKKIEYRLTKRDIPDIKKSEADLVTIIDVHFLRFDREIIFGTTKEQRIKWLQDVYDGMKPGGILAIFDKLSETGEISYIEKALKKCGFKDIQIFWESDDAYYIIAHK